MYGPALTQQTLLQKARFHDRAFFCASINGKQSNPLCRIEESAASQTTAGCTAVIGKPGMNSGIVSIGQSVDEQTLKKIGGIENFDLHPLKQRMPAGDT